MVRLRSDTPSNGEVVATVLWCALVAGLLWSPWRPGVVVEGVGAIVAFLVPLVLGPLWLARVIDVAVGIRRQDARGRESWRWLVLPVAVVAMAAALLSHVRGGDPAYTVARNRAELDAFVEAAWAGRVKDDERPWDVGTVRIRRMWKKGDCLFLVLHVSPDGESGLAHSPSGPPPGVGDWVVTQSTEHVDGPWYRYSLLDE